MLAFVLVGCRSKDNGCDDCGQLIPPYGVIASAVGGELVFFSLNDLSHIRTEQMSGWPTALEILPSGNRLVATDNDIGAFTIATLPDVDRLEQLSIGGTPIDLRVTRTALNAHLLTNNARYYRISFDSFEADTHFTGPSPRRVRLRPPIEQDAWIICRGDSTIRVIQQQGFFETRRISMPSLCTDVAFSTDGTRAYCALPRNQKLLVIDTNSDAELDSLEMYGTVVDLSISSDGRYVLCADSLNGQSALLDFDERSSAPVQLGNSAIRPRYSVASAAFFVICPTESYVLRVDPRTTPPSVTDTIHVDPIPQCMSFLEQ